MNTPLSWPTLQRCHSHGQGFFQPRIHQPTTATAARNSRNSPTSLPISTPQFPKISIRSQFPISDRSISHGFRRISQISRFSHFITHCRFRKTTPASPHAQSHLSHLSRKKIHHRFGINPFPSTSTKSSAATRTSPDARNTAISRRTPLFLSLFSSLKADWMPVYWLRVSGFHSVLRDSR